ncbi:nucleotide exchange factor GrpE [Rhodococcoides fascians]|uniref:nucleotide exchange factor GrpE n=1 Tax=Rhodococcoides fascians TaxID=1828 RepID=UPI0012D2B8A1|nr:nucleotide exchange factor GrpE [Rhodococcus fascians]
MNMPTASALIAAALLLGALVGWFAHSRAAGPDRRQAPHDPALDHALPHHDSPASDGSPDRRLVDALIGVHDLGDGVSATDRISEELHRVGVVRLDAQPGTLFDSSSQKAVHSVAAPTPDRVGTIAEAVRPGWAGPGGIIRYTEVSVYGPASAGA